MPSRVRRPRNVPLPLHRLKPTTLRGFGRVEFKPGGRLTAISVSVYQLVNAAYGIAGSSPRMGKCQNCPSWIDSEKFDVEAIAEQGVVPERLDTAQLRYVMQPMHQRWLAERFNLVIRHEPKEMPVYELTVAKWRSRERNSHQLRLVRMSA